MKQVGKFTITISTMVVFLIGGMTVGNSMNTTSAIGPNGWYCNGDEELGSCAVNYNATCCISTIQGGCSDVPCGDRGED